MLIEPFRREDIPGFLELAAAERWLTDPWEFNVLLSAFSAGCFVARDVASTPPVGFITALKHECSGWIGNLIVSQDFRRQGIGETLFLQALDALMSSGAETIWLTASTLGKSLYEKNGFSSIDMINRWSCTVGDRPVDQKKTANCSVTTPSVSSLDFQAWGDRRDALLAAVIERGKLLNTECGFLVVQPSGASLQFGPFSAQDTDAAEKLLVAALQSLPPGTTVCLDAPASNNAATQLFRTYGMRISGRNELMYAGVRPDFQAKFIYGLATMGSCG